MNPLVNLSTAALIKERTESLKVWQAEIALLRKHAKAMTKTTKHVNTVFARHPTVGAYAWTYVETWSEAAPLLRLSVIVDVKSMTTGIAPAFMRSLLEAGFDVDKTKDTATADQAQRVFEFRRPGGSGFVPCDLTFTARLQDAPDATCRKVQTGTVVKEVPIFELVCEE